MASILGPNSRLRHVITRGSHAATINMFYGDHIFGKSSHIQGGSKGNKLFSISLNLFKLKANSTEMIQTKKITISFMLH
jgi:hypothetical protein